MRRWLLLVPLLTLAPACASVQTTSAGYEPEPPIEVVLPVDRAAAFDQVLAAFDAAGLTVSQADRDGGVISAGPVPADIVTGQFGPAVATLQPFVTYRASLVPAPEGAKVVLSLWSSTRENGAAATPEVQVGAGCRTHASCSKYWAHLEQVAATLRR
jgi:S1-C subfamily serine protease